MKKTFTGLKKIYLYLFFLLLYFPVLAVVLYSFNKSPSMASWAGFTLDWYRQLFADGVIGQAFKVSMQVALLTSLLSAFIGTSAALATLFISQRMKKVLRISMILPFLVPEIALGVSLLIFFSSLKLPLGILTLVLSHSLFCAPYIYLMVYLRLSEIDKSIIEAARDLGASSWQVIGNIIMPLIAPSILSASLLAIALSLDDVIISTYMSGPRSTTLSMHIFSMMRVGVTPKINALCTLILTGTFLIIGLGQFFNRKESLNYEK